MILATVFLFSLLFAILFIFTHTQSTAKITPMWNIIFHSNKKHSDLTNVVHKNIQLKADRNTPN